MQQYIYFNLLFNTFTFLLSTIVYILNSSNVCSAGNSFHYRSIFKNWFVLSKTLWLTGLYADAIVCLLCRLTAQPQMWQWKSTWITKTGVRLCVMYPDCRPNNCQIIKPPSLSLLCLRREKNSMLGALLKSMGIHSTGLTCQVLFILMDEDRKKNEVLNVY